MNLHKINQILLTIHNKDHFRNSKPIENVVSFIQGSNITHKLDVINEFKTLIEIIQELEIHSDTLEQYCTCLGNYISEQKINFQDQLELQLDENTKIRKNYQEEVLELKKIVESLEFDLENGRNIIMAKDQELIRMNEQFQHKLQEYQTAIFNEKKLTNQYKAAYEEGLKKINSLVITNDQQKRKIQIFLEENQRINQINKILNKQIQNSFNEKVQLQKSNNNLIKQLEQVAEKIQNMKHKIVQQDTVQLVKDYNFIQNSDDQINDGRYDIAQDNYECSIQSIGCNKICYDIIDLECDKENIGHYIANVENSNKNNDTKQSQSNQEWSQISQKKTQKHDTKDPYYIFFVLIIQCIKINSPNFDVIAEYDLSDQWQILIDQRIPINLWQSHLKNAFQRRLGLQI